MTQIGLFLLLLLAITMSQAGKYFHCHAIKEKNQNGSIDIFQNQNWINILRSSPRFRSAQFFVLEILGELIYPKLSSFVWSRHVGAHSDEHQHDGRNSTQTSATEFCFESVNSSVEKLLKIEVILFLTQ